MEQEARPRLILLAGLGLALMVGCGADSADEPGNAVPVRGDATTTSADAGPTVPSTIGSSSASTVDGTTSPDVTTTSPATSPPPAPVRGDALALDLLMTIPVARESPGGYDRDLFGGWIDADGDGCNTREEVLIAESLGLAQVDPYGCTVVAGEWFSVYEGATWSDPSDVDIDHVVALKEAWDSGANGWTSSRRRAFANDVSDSRSLRAVTDNVNQSKGDADPSNWLPSRDSFVCTYISDWVAIKAHWGLSMDESEFGRIRNLLRGQCAGTTVAGWG